MNLEIFRKIKHAVINGILNIIYKRKKKYIMDKKKQFEKDEEFGKYFEFELIPFIENYFNEKLPLSKIGYWYDSAYEAKKKNDRKILKNYDLKFGVYDKGTIFAKKEITFEIKTDKFMDTGNLAFEKKYKNQFSGAFGSKADYFIYFFPRRVKENLYLIKRDRLVELFNDSKWNDYLRYGGDDGKALMYIIPANIFEVEFLKSGGKLETYEVEIPEKFGLEKFTDNSITYVSNGDWTQYPDVFDETTFRK